MGAALAAAVTDFGGIVFDIMAPAWRRILPEP
jgi:hypothetical protein